MRSTVYSALAGGNDLGFATRQIWYRYPIRLFVAAPLAIFAATFVLVRLR